MSESTIHISGSESVTQAAAKAGLAIKELVSTFDSAKSRLTSTANLKESFNTAGLGSELNQLLPIFSKVNDASERLGRKISEIHAAAAKQLSAGVLPEVPVNRQVQAATRSAVTALDTEVLSSARNLKGVTGADVTQVRRLSAAALTSGAKGLADDWRTSVRAEFGKGGLNLGQVFGDTKSLANLLPPKFLAGVAPQTVGDYQAQVRADSTAKAAQTRAAKAADDAATAATAETEAAKEGAQEQQRATRATRKKASAEEAAAKTAEEGATTAAAGGGGRRPPKPPASAAAEPPEPAPKPTPPVRKVTERSLDQEAAASEEDFKQQIKQYQRVWDRLLAQNKATFEELSTSGQYQVLSKAPGRELARDVQTGAFVSRTQGPLQEGVAEDDALLKQAKRLYAGVLQKQVKAGDQTLAEDARAKEAVAGGNAQRARDQADAVARAEQRAEYARQQGRVNAGDPFIQPIHGGFLDRAGDQPTFQKIEGGDRLVPGTQAQFDTAQRLYNEEQARKARAAKSSADTAEKRAAKDAEAYATAENRRYFDEATGPGGAFKRLGAPGEKFGNYAVDYSGQYLQRSLGQLQPGSNAFATAETAAGKLAEAFDRTAKREGAAYAKSENQRYFDQSVAPGGAFNRLGAPGGQFGNYAVDAGGQYIQRSAGQLQPGSNGFATADAAAHKLADSLSATARAAEQRAQREGAASAKIENQRYFDQSVTSGEFKRLGEPGGSYGNYAVNERTGQYIQRDTGQLQPGSNGFATAEVAARKLAEGLDAAARSAQRQGEAVAKTENRRYFDQAVATGEFKRLGDVGKPFANTAVNPNTGQYIQRDVGQLQPGSTATGDKFEAADERYLTKLIAEEAAAEKVTQSAEQLATAQREAAAKLLAQVQGVYRLEDSQKLFAQLQGRQAAADSNLQQQGTRHLIDTTNPDQPRVFETNQRTATAVELEGAERAAVLGTNKIAVARSVAADQERALVANERELQNVIKEQNKRGVLNNFLTGFSNSGFGGGPSFSGNFDGLARSAGQLVKYQALSTVMGDLTQAAGEAAKEFLDMNDSITELQVAMGDGAQITGEFTNQLQDFAALGGFNVGEAMDVAAKGIRAFRGELQTMNADLTAAGTNTQTLEERQKSFGAAYAKEASRLAVLATTTLTDSAGNLAAIAKGYQLPTSGAGLRQVTDAVAGAKLAGGGDETQIYQGLANSAVIFQQMGFSIREAATIVSKLNAETDQSGTLLATRVSRLGSILEGSAGKQFIRDINLERPAGTQAVDVNASAKDQILQLGELYKKMDAAQQQVLTSRLGGTAQAREILLLLKDAGSIIDSAGNNKLFDDAGLREFEKRLTNVRAELTVIQGNIKAVITNLAASGLALPFIELVDVVKVLTNALKSATQTVAQFASNHPVLTAIAVNFAAIAGSVALIAKVRLAGGIGNFLLAQEGRIAPGRVLNKLELSDRLGERAGAGAGALLRSAQLSTTSTYAIDSGAKAIAARTVVTGTAIDDVVAASSVRLQKAAIQLEAAEKVLRDTAASDIEGRANARAVVNRARIEAGAARGDLDLQQARQAAIGTIGVNAERETDKLTEAWATKSRQLREKIDNVDIRANAARATATSAGGADAELARLSRRRIELESQYIREQSAFNARIYELAAEREAAEGRALVAAGTGGAGNLVGAAEKAAIKGAGAEVGLAGRIGTSISGAFAGLGKLLTGPAGIALTAVGVVSAIGSASSAFNRVAEAQQAGLETAGAHLAFTAQALSQAADADKAAAANLRESSSGFFGRIADTYSSAPAINPATGQVTAAEPPWWSKAWNGIGSTVSATFNNIFPKGEASRQAAALEGKASWEEAAKAGLDRLKEQAATTATSADDLANALDFTSVDSLTTSIKKLADVGVSASKIVDAFGAALEALNFDKKPTTDALSAADRQQAGKFLGGASLGDFDTLRAQYQGVINKPRAYNPNIINDPNAPLDIEGIKAELGKQSLDNVVPKDLANIVNRTTQDFLKRPNLDLNAGDTQKAYQKVLEANLESASISPDVAKAYSTLVAGHFSDLVSNLTSAVGTAADAASAVGALPTLTQAATQEAAKRARNQQIIAGQPLDTSASVGFQAGQEAFGASAALVRTAIARLKSENKISPTQETQLLGQLQDQQNQIVADRLQQAAAYAKALTADDDKIRAHRQANATSAAQVAAIGQAYFTTDANAAIASRNVEAITAVFDKASRSQINAILQTIDADAKQKKAQYDAAKRTYDFAKAQAVKLDAQASLLAHYDPGAPETAAARTAADAADATLAGLPEPNAGPANQATQGASAAHAAADRATASDQYVGAQRAAFARKELALQSAYAVSARDDVRTSKLAVASAQIDLAEAATKDGGKKSLEYRQKLEAYYKAVNDYNDKILEAADTARKAGLDLSDPVATAGEEVKTAAAKLAADKKNGASSDQLNKDRIAKGQADITAESALHSQREGQADALFNAGRISHAAMIGMLQAEHSRLATQLALTKKGTNQYQQFTDEILENEAKIKAAAGAAAGQFNLGDIKVPTVYEVRRSLQNAAAATSTINSAVIANTTNNTITFNGADLSKMESVVRQMIGQSNRYTTAGRKA